MIKGRIHSLESFGAVDGPGIRYLIFLKGCNMRCQYCHNVDTWNPDTDNLMTADELLDKAERFRSYWGKEGGITVSGGEALLQIDFLIDLFRKAHERGINTNLDTSGQPFTREEPFFSKFNELLKYTDLVMWTSSILMMRSTKNSPAIPTKTFWTAQDTSPNRVSPCGSVMCWYPESLTMTNI